MDVASVKLRSRQGRERTVDDLTTLFDLCLVVIDVRRPSSYERLLAVVERIDKALSGADCTVGVVLVAADETDVDRVLGPLARKVAVFVDPEAQAATALGLSGTPALVWITTAPELGAVVEGWDPPAWREMLDRLADKLAWTRAFLPRPDDPAPFAARALRHEGTRALT